MYSLLITYRFCISKDNKSATNEGRDSVPLGAAQEAAHRCHEGGIDFLSQNRTSNLSNLNHFSNPNHWRSLQYSPHSQEPLLKIDRRDTESLRVDALELLPLTWTLTHPHEELQVTQEPCDLQAAHFGFNASNPARRLLQCSSLLACQNRKGTTTTHRNFSDLLENFCKQGNRDSYQSHCHGVSHADGKEVTSVSLLHAQYPTITRNLRYSPNSVQRLESSECKIDKTLPVLATTAERSHNDLGDAMRGMT